MDNKDIRILVFEFQYLSEDLDNCNDKFSKYKEDFYKEFPEEYQRMLDHQNKQNNNSETDEDNDIENTDEEDTEEESSEEDTEEQREEETNKIPKKELRKLFRRISKITHPDKVDSEFLTDNFKKAADAYEKDDISTLFMIASVLNIDVSDIDLGEVSSGLTDSISSHKLNIMMIKSSLAWRWAQASTEEEREEIRKVVRKYSEENY
jgi:hypothetical protein